MDVLLEKLNSLEISDLSKARAKDAIETICSGSRYHIIKTEEYKEYAVLINNTIVVKSKQYDYAGAVALRKETPVSLEDFVSYLESRAVEIEETQTKIRGR